MVLAPLVESRKGEFQSVFEDVRKAGFVRARVDGEVRDLSEKIELENRRSTRSRWSSRDSVASRQSEYPVAHRRLGRAGAAARLGPGDYQWSGVCGQWSSHGPMTLLSLE